MQHNVLRYPYAYSFMFCLIICLSSSCRDSVDAGSAVKVFPGTHDKLGSYAARSVF